MPKVCRSILLPDFAFSWDCDHSPHKVVLSKGFHSSYVLFGEKTTCRIVLSCFVIVIGYALGIGGEINFSLKGTLFGLGASIVGAFYTILLKYYLSYVMPDRWTTKTVDGTRAAHYENTVLITDGEPEILTVCEDR